MGWVGMNEQWPKAGEEVITKSVIIHRNGEIEVVEALRTWADISISPAYPMYHWEPALGKPENAIQAEVTHWHPYRNYTLLYRQGSEEKRVDRVKHISSPIERGTPEEHYIELWSGETIYADELQGALDEQGNVLWMKEEES